MKPVPKPKSPPVKTVTRYVCQGKQITREEAQRIDEENKALMASPLEVDWMKIRVVMTYQEKVGELDV